MLYLALIGPAPAATNPFPVRATVVMLPSTYANETITEMTFVLQPRDGVLYLWPRAADAGGGGTNLAGITNINGITNASQTFAAGTAGADFAISSAGSTHTFNLPTASTVNRGALSAADWTTFNGKQGGMTWQSNGTTIATAPTTVSLSNAALMALNGNTLNIATGGSGTPASSSGAIQFNEGGVFAGTNGASTKFVYDRTNNILRVVGQLPRILMEDNTVLTTNEYGAGYLDSKNSEFSILTIGVNRWKFGGSGSSVGHLFPNASNVNDIGLPASPVRAAYIGTNDSRDSYGERVTVTNATYLGANVTDGILYAWDSANGVYRQALLLGDTSMFWGEATVDHSFTGASATFDMSKVRPFADNTTVLGEPTRRWRDGLFANTLNTTGLVAGITYVALTSGSYTNSTNNFTVMMPNGSARTNWLNSASAVGCIQVVKDTLGTAAGTNLIVKATSGLIDEAASYTINTSRGAAWFQFNGTNWIVIATKS